MALNLKEELLSKEELHYCVENGPPDPGQDFPLALDIPNGCETRVDLLDWHFKDDIIEKKIENEDIDIILGADIVYDWSLVAPLCNVLRIILSKKYVEGQLFHEKHHSLIQR